MRNWAGNIEYRARRLIEPRSIDELHEAVRAADRLRVLGSRHAFNALADTDGDLVSLARLPRRVEIDPDAMAVTVDGALRYGDLAPLIDDAGFALDNLASLPHISIAGACATGTHGSGVRSRALPAAVRAVELLRTDGETATFDRDTDPATFPGVPVSLGALGVVTGLTLDLVPRYDVEQRVYEDLPLAAFRAGFDDILAAGDSVSAFTTWRDDVVDQVWVKRRVPDGDGSLAASPPVLGAARRATAPRHPVPGMDPAACTDQLGVPGPWYQRLPHFRLDHTPSAGDELQSEWFVAANDAAEAFDALHALRRRTSPLVLVSEIRTIAADDLWLSPAYRRESVAFHFTWRPDWPSVRPVIEAIEAAMAPFEPRPHWAKLFSMAPEAVAAAYPRHADASALATTLDPAGKLRNPFLDRYLFAGP